MKKSTIGLVSLFVCLTMLTTTLPATAFTQSTDTKNQSSTRTATGDSNAPTVPTGPYPKPANIAQLITWYQALEAQYPGYLELIKMNDVYGTGTITGGYDDYYLRITNESRGLNKPEVLFLGNVHGDETQGTVGNYWFADWLMRMAFTNEPCPFYSKAWLRWIIDNREIYLEVSHNPYGYDHQTRYDGNGWDLNRESDMNGPGDPTGGIWASVQGKTLVDFVNDHQIRFALDWHSGARLLLYSWGSTHSSVSGTSPISGHTYHYAPPDFYFFDAASLRLGNYIGDYGGNLDANSIGTIPDTVGYTTNGDMCSWGYGSNTAEDPVEAPYVHYGPYPGAGIAWISPEMSNIKDTPASQDGNDTVTGYCTEVRRIILHQTDLAQPNIQVQAGTVPDGFVTTPNATLSFRWAVNGSLVVDHTSIQWGTNPDPINHSQYTTTDHDTYNGQYVGGTGWDGANDGHTTMTIYSENITPMVSGNLYFVIKAQVDQIYANVLRPDVYHNNPYLRIIKERTNDSFLEQLQSSTDGLQTIQGHTWWYSPVIHVIIAGGAPAKPSAPEGKKLGKVGRTYSYTTSTTDPDENETLYYDFSWGDTQTSGWIGPYAPGVTVTANHTWSMKGDYTVKVKAKDKYGLESAWSNATNVKMPYIPPRPFLTWLLEHFPHAFPLLRALYGA